MLNPKKILLLLIFIQFWISCSNDKSSKIEKNEKTVIEIYLPKKRIQTKKGIKVTDSLLDKKYSPDLKKLIEKDWKKNVRYDTIKKRFIYAGEFKATKKDLPEKPFINDNEIIDFDFNTNTLILSKTAVEKIKKMHSDIRFSKQFVLTSNKKPILCGYFYNIISSYYVDTYYIIYDRTIKIDKTKETFNFILRKIPMMDSNYKELPNMKLKKDFYDAFKKRKTVHDILHNQ